MAWILGAEALPGHIDPQHRALVWADEERTYAQLRRRALSLAGAMRARGLNPGDRVAGHLLNRGETFELYFACAYAGLTFVSVSWRLTANEIGMIMDDCQPTLAFTQQSVAEHLTAAADPRGVDVVILDDDRSGELYEQFAEGEGLPGPYPRTNPHLILYTSGTTGRPKGVMLNHDNICWFAMQQALIYPGLDGRAVTMINLPTFNTAGINEQSIPTFLVGGTIGILPSGGWTPRAMGEAIDRWSVTMATILPSMMQPFLDADAEREIGLATLRVVATGGENCPPAVMARFQERWPQAVLYQGYGSTESGIVTEIAGEEWRKHPGSVGRAAVGMTFRIQGPDRELVGSGEVGEIWAAGGSIVPGYWNAPELNASVLDHGWLNTGDLGWQDEDGYLYLAGRSRDLIISKGQNIYPAEIENAIAAHDAVHENSVVGLPDPEWGEVVCAAVVVKDGHHLEAADLVTFVQGRLASYKKPRHVVMVDELPRGQGGKVQKAEVASLVAAALGRDGV